MMPSPAPAAWLADSVRPQFTDGSAVAAYFVRATGTGFIDWFNRRVASTGHWGKAAGHAGPQMQAGDAAEQRLLLLWDRLPELLGSPFTLAHVLALTAIVVNETGGCMQPVTERIGNRGHPGLAYAFDRIPGIKRSYNTLPTNRTALDLFNDARYVGAHGRLAGADGVARASADAWRGERYPDGADTSLDPARTGFVQQADFYKFRGRGLIQTTTRGNYRPLIEFVRVCRGRHPLLDDYRTRWRDADLDTIATTSHDDDWNRLFQQTDMIVPIAAIRLHNAGAGDYLGKLTAGPDLTARIRAMGRAIGGAARYADVFTGRVLQMFDTLAAA